MSIPLFGKVIVAPVGKEDPSIFWVDASCRSLPFCENLRIAVVLILASSRLPRIGGSNT
jgi:hypothetical protein